MDRAKIGLALSGASGRAIAHAGVLDALKENGIQVDYIAACSSATIIAAAYSSGTLDILKEELFNTFNHKELFNIIGPSKGGGLFSLSKAENRLRAYTKGMNMEDVKPQLAFVAVDLNTAEQISISMGDMVKGIIASCSVPGLFEPIKWGNRNLADGGLINLVPADVVRAMGADIVISIDIAASKYIFSDGELRFLKSLIWLIKGTASPYIYLRKLLSYLKEKFIRGNFIKFYSQSDFLNGEERLPSILQVIGRVIEISMNKKAWAAPYELVSDIIISPKVKHLGRTEFTGAKLAYIEGKKATLRALPEIKSLIARLSAGELDRRIQSQLPLTPKISADLATAPSRLK